VGGRDAMVETVVAQPIAVDESRLRRVLIAVILTQLLIVIDFFALNLALPPMARDFGVAPTDLQFVISGYMIAIGALMIPAGRIADLIGRRRVTVIGVAVFGVASAICGAAPNETIVIVFRIVEGVGAAMCFPVSIALVTASFPADRVQRALGTVYAFAAIGQALGPLVGGLLSEVNWRWVFFVNVPVAAVAGVLLQTAIRHDTRDEAAGRHIDWLGAVLVSTGLVLATVSIDNADEWGWGSGRTLGVLGAGVLLLVVFVVVELRIAHPLVDLRLFRQRAYAVIVTTGTVANCAYVIVIFGATLYLQDVRGLSPSRSAVAFLAMAVGAAVAGQLAGRLDKMPPERVEAFALAVGGVGVLVMTASESWYVYLPAFALVGLGLGLGWSYASVGTQIVVPPAQSAVASGVTLTALVAFGGVAVALGATAIDQLAGTQAVHTAGPINDVLRVCGIVCLVVAALAPFVGRTERRVAGA
jgi:EmrB/QacA subfamily drug resistance transporter